MADWNPSQTIVFIIGTLKWEDSDSFGSFDSDNRKDEELMKFFLAAGVPDEHVHYYCDEEAVTSTIKDDLKYYVSRAQEQDTLFFYYCGHGYGSDDDGYFFATYDCSENVKMPMKRVVDTVYRHFRGKTAILMADCCKSGYICNLVNDYNKSEVNKRLRVAAFGSVYYKKTSTGNWTFSIALLAALKGQPYLEFDDDGTVTLQELERHIMYDMALFDKQYASSCLPNHMRNWILTCPVKPRKHPRIGERILVDWNGVDYMARIEKYRPGEFYVCYFSYASNERSWISEDEAKPLDIVHYTPGTRLDILSDDDGKWYPCRVLTGFCGLHLIKFDDYDDTYNEWATQEQLRFRS
ncbi:unnamed protein product [Didymodactylos carnosus]|uniref:Peptidase C14 caspase domain-containing protein n=1 Tax=Didymodactylos carnosus TaxID=1234261 RepID=A0A8S2DV12_9BILA|nr:unnamed protein product [Didymodactylos carnosus]CAF3784919.1 unnamed protein product [Didymodactylos carnosus]